MADSSRPGNWSSRHFVSWIASTSMSLASSHVVTRSMRLRMELTFQVAISTSRTYPDALRPLVQVYHDMALDPAVSHDVAMNQDDSAATNPKKDDDAIDR